MSLSRDLYRRGMVDWNRLGCRRIVFLNEGMRGRSRLIISIAQSNTAQRSPEHGREKAIANENGTKQTNEENEGRKDEGREKEETRINQGGRNSYQAPPWSKSVSHISKRPPRHSSHPKHYIPKTQSPPSKPISQPPQQKPPSLSPGNRQSHRHDT